MTEKRKVWPTDYTPELDEKDKLKGIRCPKCLCARNHVFKSVSTYGNRRYRRRECCNCAHRWTTFES